MRVAVSPARRNSRAHSARYRPGGGRAIAQVVGAYLSAFIGAGPSGRGRGPLRAPVGDWPEKQVRRDARGSDHVARSKRRHPADVTPTRSTPHRWSKFVTCFRCGRSGAAFCIAHVAADRSRCAPVQLLASQRWGALHRRLHHAASAISHAADFGSAFRGIKARSPPVRFPLIHSGAGRSG